MPYTDDFFADQERDSVASARIVLRKLWAIVQPSSVIDVGCGIGAWLKVASQLGAQHIVGIDGEYVPRDRLLIDHSSFRACNLEETFPRLGNRACFDLVISLEVAEHLPKSRSESFIGELCGLSDLILFSAAIPGQPGTHHINLQWPAYWNALFLEYGFSCFDFLRMAIWEDNAVRWWYAQNTFLFAKKRSKSYETLSLLGSPVAEPTALVHPKLFVLKEGMHAAVMSSKAWKVAATLQAVANFARNAGRGITQKT